MLRILKQKTLMIRHSDNNNNKNDEAIALNTETPIVSHVPVSVSCRGVASCDNSTISSKSHDRPLTTRAHGSQTSLLVEEIESRKKEDSSCLSKDECSKRRSTASPATLLALPDDSLFLNPFHVFIRKQIELFTATELELREPAPGRKHSIQLHQVGIRCIHCKGKPKLTRVKRAVCYPSNLGRLYNAVSDMKFDHFSSCRNLPLQVRQEFSKLKGSEKGSEARGKGRAVSTAQYYCDTASMLGMYDGKCGIFRSDYTPNMSSRKDALSTCKKNTMSSIQSIGLHNGSASNPLLSVSNQKMILLQDDPDEDRLNAIHCFVRKHTEFFEATAEDLAAPAPGRKMKLKLGQVGIRCIHCKHLPSRQKVKRAVCYPPRIDGIYHTVSNMKFDHFAKCQILPEQNKAEFLKLQESFCRKGSGGNANGAANSTKRFYRLSAIRKGLVDTDSGIRFEQPSQKLSSSVTNTSARMSILMDAAFKAL